jgi:hypothetical protein
MRSQLLRIALILGGFFFLLSNSENPPNGRTGAPFNTTCNDCHSNNNPGEYAGNVFISGIPNPIPPSTTFPVTITVTVTAGNPVRAGFQLVVVQGNNANAGDLQSVNGETGTEMLGGREYIDHRNPKHFNGNSSVSWTFNWTSSANANGNQAKFYFTANLTNGDNNNTGDFVIWGTQTFNHIGGSPLAGFVHNTTDVSCYGGNDGAATVFASGGTPPYFYSWPDNQNTPTVYNLSAGAHSVTVTDNAGMTATINVIIDQPEIIQTNLSTIWPLNCHFTSHNITSSPIGGTPGYSYLWSNGATGHTLSVSTPGLYSLTVTDAQGCTQSIQFTVEQDTLHPLAVAGPSQFISCQQPQATLNGEGSSFGNDIIYNWSTIDGHIVSGSGTLNPIVDQAGTYILTVVNLQNICVDVDTTTVTGYNTLPQAIAQIPGEISCLQPQLHLDGNGSSQGTGIIYNWSTLNGHIVSGANTLMPLVDYPGAYTLEVIDTINWCSAMASVVVTGSIIPPVINIAQPSSLNCDITTVQINALGSSFGSVYITTWTTPNGHIISGANTLGPEVNAAGLYILQIINGLNGCVSTDSVQVTQNTTIDAIISATTAVSCPGGSDGGATVMAAGESMLSFEWPTGDTSASVAGLQAGIYPVTISDESNCQLVVVANIDEPDPINLVPQSINHVECPEEHNGQIIVAATGGVAPYTYLWSHGATGALAFALVVDTYSVTATDANGCMQTLAVDLIAQDTIKPLIECEPDITLCEGDALFFDFPAVTDNCGLPLMITQTEGLPSGSVFPLGETLQTFEVADQSGNTAECSHTVTVSPVPELAFDITGDVNNEGTGAIQATVGSGNVIQYFWIGPDNFTAETADIEGLIAGVYLLRATDANGCSAEYAVQVPLVVGTDFPQDLVSLHLYPNPATDQIQIDMQGAIQVSAQLFDARGSLWATWDAEMLKAPLDVTALPAGVYILLLIDDQDNRHLLRWVKME